MKRLILSLVISVCSLTANANDFNPYDPNIRGYIVERIAKVMTPTIEDVPISYADRVDIAECEYDTAARKYQYRVHDRILKQILEDFAYLHNDESTSGVLEPGEYTDIFSHCLYALDIPKKSSSGPITDSEGHARGQAFTAVKGSLKSSSAFYKLYPSYVNAVSTCIIGLADTTALKFDEDFKRQFWKTLVEYAENDRQVDVSQAQRMFDGMYEKCSYEMGTPEL